MTQAEIVTSAQNSLLKDIRRARARGTLTSKGLWIAESIHLLNEAYRSDLNIPAVIAAESARHLVPENVTARLVVVPDQLFGDLATTGTPQGVMALVEPPPWKLEDILGNHGPVIMLDGIQDPGNAGSIMRSAEAFGAGGVIFLKRTVSPHHPKTLRAAAGSLFRVPFVTGVEVRDVRELLDAYKRLAFITLPEQNGVRLVKDLVLKSDAVFIIGSEGRGVSDDLIPLGEGIAIGTAGVESLNAAIAAAILLYEVRRQNG